MIFLGVNLPDIPSDILEEYPYWAVYKSGTKEESFICYHLLLSKSELVSVPYQMHSEYWEGWNYGIAYSEPNGKYYTLYDNNANDASWTEESAAKETLFDIDYETIPTGALYFYLVASNHNIHIAMDYNNETGIATPGTEIYRYAHQNYDGIWLPQTPETALDYSYTYIIGNFVNNKYGEKVLQSVFLVSRNVETYVETRKDGSLWIMDVTSVDNPALFYLYNNYNNDYWNNMDDQTSKNRLNINENNYIIWSNFGILQRQAQRYSIYGFILEDMANQVRRLTNTTADVYPEDMPLMLENIRVNTGNSDGVAGFIDGTLTYISNSQVSSIRASAFLNCSNLTSVNFPACTTISNSAFYNCSNLTYVNFPVCTTIGQDAFLFCYKLESINFPICESIKAHAFAFASSITAIDFPVCTSIGYGAFTECENLTTINLPVCTTIGASAFYKCSNLTSVNIPACTAIGGYAFNKCSNLTSVSFPVCTSIGYGAFCNCLNLNTVSFPVCTTIDGNAFEGCDRLTSVNFPVCTTISSYAFNCCDRLTDISFPVCATIGSWAFRSCPSLTSVSFPVCTDIGSYAFIQCYNLQNVVLANSSIVNLLNENAFSSTPMSNSTYTGSFGSIYVPVSLVDAYKTASNWSYYSNRITSIENLV